MEKISVVVSCYNEEKALPLFYEEMERVRKKDFEGIVEFEYIFVNDGSKDNTLKIINKMSNIEMVDGARDYRLMKRQVVDSIISLKEYNRYSKGLFSFVGFDTKWIEYENVERVAGETKWSFWKLFKYALEGITAFSTTPLIFSSIVGLIFCLVAFIAIIFIIVKTLVYGDPTAGWPSMACIIVFVSGIQLFTIGIIGQYLSKTYLEVKKRPIYIIKETEKDYTKK